MHILIKSDWKSPVGAGLLGFLEALRIFRERPLIPSVTGREVWDEWAEVRDKWTILEVWREATARGLNERCKGISTALLGRFMALIQAVC